MAEPINDPNAITPPVTGLPPSLSPLKRGAAIDWKATALAEHARAERLRIDGNKTWDKTNELREKLSIQSESIRTLRSELLSLTNKLQAIRDHWSAFLLPRDLRR